MRGEDETQERWEAARNKPRPQLWARFGPYARLTVSALLHMALFLGGLGAVIAALRDMSGFSILELVFGALVVLWMLVFAGSWLRRVPGTFVAMNRMLNEEYPEWAHLSVSAVEGSDDSKIYWANLRVGGRELRFKLTAILRPWWLDGGIRNVGVWLHGYRPDADPPWVLEFEDGYLALVYPDPDDLVRPH
jgi:hypothetical protein